MLLCDHTKLGRRHLMKVAHLQKVDVVITDSEAPGEIVSELRRLGIEVVVT